MLKVRLIGKFDIQCNGKPVIISSRAAQSLFAYLILTVGTSHRREKLAGMFWPDAPEEKARAYLRHELWRIRKAFPKKSKVDFLIADDIYISFNSGAEYWLDVNVLMTETQTIEDLPTALSVFQGELLPGFYDEWIVLEREHLRAVYEQKMAQLLAVLEEKKRWSEILEWTERWISLGGAPEAAFRYLMVAYGALGDHAKVASTFERCIKALGALDLEISEETRALAFKRSPKLNIPIPLTSFIGREKEMKEVADLFSKSRLVTLTGSGGVGKTRLAIQVTAEVLDRFPDGVWFLDLASLNDATLVPNTLANLLQLRESGELPITELLINYFRSRMSLIIFDNCEHLIESCAQLVNSLLISCQNLSVLATSREALRVAGEIPYRVPSLKIPKHDIKFSIDQLADIEAVKLFVARAALASRGLAINQQNTVAIAQICRRLDGIPLAIELAATLTNMLTVEQILKRLDDRFNLLTHGLRTSLPRHQTLRAMIDWSYDLLSEHERVLFKRLAVFVGGWTLEAAEEVCSGNGIESEDVLALLSQLVNKSLVLVETVRGERRYRRLETIRQYAREKLRVASEAEIIKQRHLSYFADLAERAEPNLRAFGMMMWLDRLEAEIDNIRVALEYALERNIEMELRLASALSWFWHIRGHKNEGIGWLEQGLSLEAIERGNQPLIPNRARTRGKALCVAGFLSLMLVEIDKGTMFLEESLTLFRGLGTVDGQGIAYVLLNLSRVAHNRMDLRRQKALLEESLAHFLEMGDKFGMADCLHELGHCASDQGDYERARSLFEAHLALCQEIGDKDGNALALFALGYLASEQSNFNQATIYFEASISLYREVRNRWGLCFVLSALGQVAQLQGAYRRANTLLEEALVVGQDLGDKHAIASRLNELGSVARSQGDYERAIQMHEQALLLFRDVGNQFAASYTLCNLGFAALARADTIQAVKMFEEALAISRETDDKLETAFALYGKGRLAQSQGNFALACKLHLDAMAIFRQLDVLSDVARGEAHCLEAFAIMAVTQKQMMRAAHLFGASETLYAPLRFEMSCKERDEHDQAIAMAQVALGEEAFAAAYEEGNKLTLDEAVAYVIEGL